MPYIKNEERASLDVEIKQLSEKLAQRYSSTLDGFAGRLNYTITKIVLEYFESRKSIQGNTKINYADWNEVIGALECCKFELYRRLIAPYEDEKIQQNGDVKVQQK